MSALKKFLSGLTVLALMSGSFTVFAVSDSTFSDVSDADENAIAIYYLKDAGVVQGYADGTYKPATTINRAEFLKILMEAAALQTGGANCFKDVQDGWFAPYVCKAAELGLVKGYEDGNFRPAQDISFAEASKIVVNTLEIKPTMTDGSIWYEGFVKALEDLDAIPKTINSFGHYVTRGEMAEIIWRIKEQPSKASLSYLGVKRREASASTEGALSTFDSCTDLQDYLRENTEVDYYYGDEEVMMKDASPSSGLDGVGATGDDAAAVPEASEGLGAGAESFSETNVQVEGVDEADIVKTDGKYIYLVKGSTIKIVRAFPPEDMDTVATIELEDKQLYPEQLYVDGDKLVLIQSAYYYDYLISPFELESGIVPNLDGNLTQVSVYDISDPADPKVVREVAVEGAHQSSRKVDDTVYLVTNQYNYYGIDDEDPKIPVPLLGDSKTGKMTEIADCSDIWYVPGSTGTSYTTVSAISVDDPNAKVDAEVVMGADGEVYASRDNLYLAEYGFDWWWGSYDDDETTVIHKFALDGDNVAYKGKGEVPGTILNQFSMDEYNGNFRIATTTGSVWDSANPSKNNVYVLDANLSTVGKLEGIAPGEKIYSVRFMGKRLYMVTFKKVDPFFVIDVADPKAPKILGKLKIPGYSDYLHPFDENHIIGFGKEAVDASENELAESNFDFAWYQGMKVAMFDVTDVANPVEMDKVVIGDRGTDSPLLWDHKALLFDKKHSLIAFPVTLAEIPEEIKNDPNTSDNTYGDYTFQGAYVYGVSLDGGFEYKGRITHYSTDEVADLAGYYWYGDSDVSRILYMDDYLYTVSMALIKANKASDLSEVSEIELK
ncbi:beta-propeller domain-containing protein [Candidatus Peregrinibacteria bacterium]|nr:beta-propeller domain-containing protein [Candidatus Peregrinibacteria bacterium]